MTTRPKAPRSRSLLVLFKVALAAGVLAWLSWRGALDFHALKGALDEPIWLSLGFVTIAGCLVLGSLRWWVLLRSQGFDRGLKEVNQLTFVGIFFNSFMPGAVGGDLVKALYIAREEPLRRAAAVLSVALDRAIGLAALCIIALFAALPNHALLAQNRPLLKLVVLAAACLGAGALALVALASERFGHLGPVRRWAMLQRARAALLAYQSVPGAVAASFVISMANHALLVFCVFCLGQALGGGGLTLAQQYLVIPFGLLANAIPISIGGLGVGEAAFEALFGMATGQATNAGGEIALLMHICFLIWNFGGGGIFFITYRSQIRAIEAEALEEEESQEKALEKG